MKIIGFILLLAGCAVAAYAFSMDVSIAVGRGGDMIDVANIERLFQRLNFIIIAGVLVLAGAAFVGFGSLQRSPDETADRSEDVPVTQPKLTDASGAVSVKICPYCKFMGEGDATICARCETKF